MNCFQKLLSSWWRTTIVKPILYSLGLWIAFKNYYLRDEEQRSGYEGKGCYSCELLSKIIIFVMKNNKYSSRPTPDMVVNCFQKLLSSWWRTTKRLLERSLVKLWIAFKNYYLRDEEQQCLLTQPLTYCCELLSKIIIFVMKNNLRKSCHLPKTVVNCFQKLLSSWWRTTLRDYENFYQELWIAFKNYYLRDEEQHYEIKVEVIDGCELLSKIIIFVMKNNPIIFFAKLTLVVNCFQKLLSSWWRTTIFKLRRC